jgi:hypothetical protein
MLPSLFKSFKIWVLQVCDDQYNSILGVTRFSKK